MQGRMSEYAYVFTKETLACLWAGFPSAMGKKRREDGEEEEEEGP